jgi:hypothetical protein
VFSEAGSTVRCASRARCDRRWPGLRGERARPGARSTVRYGQRRCGCCLHRAGRQDARGPARRRHGRRGAELDLSRADSPRSRMDEERPCGLQVAALDQGEVTDVEREEERGGLYVIEAVGSIERHVGVRENLLRVRSERAGRGRDDAPSKPLLRSRWRAQPRPRLPCRACTERRIDRAIATEAAIDLVEVQRRRGGSDDHVTGTGGWLLDLVDLEGRHPVRRTDARARRGCSHRQDDVGP